eukprot:2666768-Pleurochrysis_carterae.AAC.1
MDFLNAAGVHNDTIMVVRSSSRECLRSIVQPSHHWTGHREALNSTRQRFTLSSTACTTTPIRTT